MVCDVSSLHALYISPKLSDNRWHNMKNKTIFITISLLSIIFIGVSLTLFMVSYNYTPKELGPAAITFWFIGFLVAVSSLIVLLEFLWKLRRSDHRDQPRKALLSSLNSGLLLGFCAAVLLALSSLRSLTLRDVILLGITVVIVELFFRTRRK